MKYGEAQKMFEIKDAEVLLYMRRDRLDEGHALLLDAWITEHGRKKMKLTIDGNLVDIYYHQDYREWMVELYKIWDTLKYQMINIPPGSGLEDYLNPEGRK